MPFKNVPPLYLVWQGMKRRCLNPNNPAYKNYGGRGIKICERWINDYHAFASDMGERPPGTSLDRIDNNLGYFKENCRWATKKQQQRNQTVTRIVTVEGRQYIAADLSEISGIKTDSILERAKKGLPLDQVLSPKKHIYKPGLALGASISSAARKARTHCKNGHEWTESNTGLQANGARRCRKCHAEKETKRRALRRLA